MGEVIQLQGDQRKDVQEFLVAKDGLELDAKTIKVSTREKLTLLCGFTDCNTGSRFLNASTDILRYPARSSRTDRSCRLIEKHFPKNDYFLRPTPSGRCSGQVTIAFAGWEWLYAL